MTVPWLNFPSTATCGFNPFLRMDLEDSFRIVYRPSARAGQFDTHFAI